MLFSGLQTFLQRLTSLLFFLELAFQFTPASISLTGTFTFSGNQVANRIRILRAFRDFNRLIGLRFG